MNYDLLPERAFRPYAKGKMTLEGGGGGAGGKAGKVLGVVAAIALPVAGAALGGAIMAGDSVMGGVIGGALGGAAGAAINGGNALTGALMGGVGGGIMNAAGGLPDLGGSAGGAASAGGGVGAGGAGAMDAAAPAASMPAEMTGVTSPVAGTTPVDLNENAGVVDTGDALSQGASTGGTSSGASVGGLSTPTSQGGLSAPTSQGGLSEPSTVEGSIGQEPRAGLPTVPNDGSSLGAKLSQAGQNMVDTVTDPKNLAKAGLQLGTTAIGAAMMKPNLGTLNSYLNSTMGMAQQANQLNIQNAQTKAGIGADLTKTAQNYDPSYYAQESANSAATRDAAGWAPIEQQMRAQGASQEEINAEKNRYGLQSSLDRSTAYDQGWQTGQNLKTSTLQAAGGMYGSTPVPTAGDTSNYLSLYNTSSGGVGSTLQALTGAESPTPTKKNLQNNATS